jgi:hypothetical protein
MIFKFATLIGVLLISTAVGREKVTGVQTYCQMGDEAESPRYACEQFGSNPSLPKLTKDKNNRFTVNCLTTGKTVPLLLEEPVREVYFINSSEMNKIVKDWSNKGVGDLSSARSAKFFIYSSGGKGFVSQVIFAVSSDCKMQPLVHVEFGGD